MASYTVVNIKNENVGTIGLSDDVFNAVSKEHLYYDVIKSALAGIRGGNAKTKERWEVRGGGRKPFKQKGTGSARMGTTRSPLCVGGGTIFGPKPHDYFLKVNKKVKKSALKTVLKSKLETKKLVVVDQFKLDTIKTKPVSMILSALGVSNGVVIDIQNDVLRKSARNIKHIKYSEPEGLNLFDLLKYDHLVITKNAFLKIEERLK